MSTHPSSDPFSCLENGNNNSNNKRKRRPAGTPDPDAEVVSLSPKTLLESDRYVCEICNQGFQRDQNLQMHRRRHKVPWKLLKRETPAIRKRVFVCPEPSCLHHDPCHALGDLVGIKKHFRRKHSNQKQWVCERCSKGYAVQSDYKAHLKTCGTRGHSCDCGRVFSRVESFIEHQDACNMGRLQPGCLSRTASSPSPSSENNQILPKTKENTIFLSSDGDYNYPRNTTASQQQNLELQLLSTSSNPMNICPIFVSNGKKSKTNIEDRSTELQLSIGSSNNNSEISASPRSISERAREELRLAMTEKAYAEEARQQAKRQIALAEQEFDNAKRIRQQAQAELDKAQRLKENATTQINSAILQITCHACKQQFQARRVTEEPPDENSLVLSYVSSALTTEGEVENNKNL